MKKIGILGGISAASTVQYYNKILDLYYEIKKDYYYPEICIESLNFQYFTDFENRISDYAYQTYLRGRAAEALAEYNADERNEDRPLREADGTLVKFLDK